MALRGRDPHGILQGAPQPPMNASNPAARSDAADRRGADDAIDGLVHERRLALHGQDDGRRAWGLALSGGGIRSATFCLGLLKALARQGQLLRFDLLSTVSGGGYVGATLGQLCSKAASPREVRAVADAMGQVECTRFGRWLRANGRYLIPGGIQDSLFAGALYLRNLLAVHIELAIAATLAGLVLAAVNLVAWDAAARLTGADFGQVSPVVLAILNGLSRWPTLWILALVPFAWSVLLACAYWSVGDRRHWRGPVLQAGAWAFALVVVVLVSFDSSFDLQGPKWLAPAFVAFALCWIVALLWMGWAVRSQPAAALRNRLTGQLATALRWMLVIGLLGVLDRAGWWLAADAAALRVHVGLALLAAAAALRAALPLLMGEKRQAPGIGEGLLLVLASLLGLLLAFCLAAWWIAVLYAAVLLPVFQPDGLDFLLGWIWWALIGGIVLGYALLTQANLDFLNLSSLHNFYRARITRAYLGAANADRLGGGVLDRIDGLDPPLCPIGAVHPDDDAAQADYAPHAHGGPVHLINVCVNQTHDPKQRLFNRDRKSLPLTVGPRGWMQAGDGPWTAASAAGSLTLSAWTAISGAAIAPGLGRLGRRGISTLTMFAGLRLGYWWNSARAGLALAGGERTVRGWLRKTHFVLDECFGAFPGSESPQWYLSDGGHFENTGAWALLKRRCELIVLADCGADPQYRFCDLENLIRRARIDLGAEITLLAPRADADPPAPETFGSLAELASREGQTCLALARVVYRDGQCGHMVLVKPNVWSSLPVDLANFKQAHPAFPQEPTTDQFFGEAQWESYFRLGDEIGVCLAGPLLEAIAAGRTGAFEPDSGAARQLARAAGAKAAPAAGAPASSASSPLGRMGARFAGAGLVRTSVGLGAFATAGLAAWQAIDGVHQQQVEAAKADEAALKELTTRWGRLGAVRAGAADPAAALLAAELLRTGAQLCGRGSDNFLSRSPVSGFIVLAARQACAAQTTGGRAASPACDSLLHQGSAIACLDAPAPVKCPVRYWARDYSGHAGAGENCAENLPAAGAWLQALRGLWGQPGVRTTAAAVDAVGAVAPPAYLPEQALPGIVVGVGPVVAQGTVPPASLPTPEVPASTAAPPSSAVESRPPVDQTACRGKLVYLQVFGAAQRADAEQLGQRWRALGATVPPVEDVLATAYRAGRAPPRGYRVPTILYPSPGLKACAALLGSAPYRSDTAWDIRLLPEAVRARSKQPPAAIEVWLPAAY